MYDCFVISNYHEINKSKREVLYKALWSVVNCYKFYIIIICTPIVSEIVPYLYLENFNPGGNSITQ